MAGKETTKSESGSLLMQAEQRKEDLGANEKAEQKNLNQDLGAEEEQREESRSTNDRIEQQDLNQGMDTGTSSFTHRGVNWGSSYRVTPETGQAHPMTQHIEARAYELYLQRGGEDGQSLEDWLTAEKELKRGRH